MMQNHLEIWSTTQFFFPKRSKLIQNSDLGFNFARFGSKTCFFKKCPNDSAWFCMEELEKQGLFIKQRYIKKTDLDPNDPAKSGKWFALIWSLKGHPVEPPVKPPECPWPCPFPPPPPPGEACADLCADAADVSFSWPPLLPPAASLCGNWNPERSTETI